MRVIEVTWRRTLHVLDVENLGRGPQCDGRWLAWALGRFRKVAVWREGDHGIGAASTYCYKRVCFDLPTGIRVVPAGAGADVADRRLIEEVCPEWTAARFDRVVFGSGDHIYADLARDLRRRGVTTWAVAWSDTMSRELRQVVDVVRYLDTQPATPVLKVAA
ncbi:MAG TPA: hypothetical protein VK007_10050 [Acidimicrobiales bacterium]|nr:hypothetical protein [Acidimicrobiales bacterium]